MSEKNTTAAAPDALAQQGPAAVVPAITLQLTAIQTTVSKVEGVRKYIQKNLNVGQRRLLKKIGKRVPTPAESAQLKELEIDFGTIPAAKKPFLKQPGAEKIALWLHVRPVYVTEVTPIPDHPGHIEVHGRCKLMAVSPDGQQVEMFSGPLASCTTMESNYRYRWVKMDPPPTFDWAKKEGRIGRDLGTHRSFKKDNEWVWQERHENPNIYDEHNKVRQIGEKRMLVKAIRNFGALSEIFTEDPSEWVLDDQGAPATAEEQPAAPGSVVREPEPDSKLEQTVEIRWPRDTAEVAMVHIPDCPAGAALAEKVRDFCEWNTKINAWQCPASYVSDVAKLATDLGLRIVEIEQPKPPSAPPEEQLEGVSKGLVSVVNKLPGRNKGSKGYYMLVFGGRTVYCYHESMWEHLAKAKDQECEFAILSGQYPKIVGIQRIGKTEFHEGVPVIQRKDQ